MFKRKKSWVALAGVHILGAVIGVMGCDGMAGVPAGGDDPVDTSTGQAIFTTAQVTIEGTMLSCSGCHGDDGSGGTGPDIRGENGGHLEEHAQGGGRHPDGVKFPELTLDDFNAIALFLGGSESLDDPDAVGEALTGDPDAGKITFEGMHVTEGGASISCTVCHGVDGSGISGPDIRGSSGPHLQEHAAGAGPHPDGIKFTELTAQDFADIAAHLAVGGGA